jgi:hypothetical protein
MSEKPPEKIEQKNPKESHPSESKIKEVFEKITDGQKYKELRKLEDQEGIYLWEIVLETEEGKTEYEYMRKGSHKEGGAIYSAIHVNFYDKDDMPIGGDLVTRYEEKDWDL